ncbi:MAG: SUMO conjugating enzyme Hus5, partial [Marteilia pararefringens]
GLWHGGFYRLILTFPTNYPLNPPVARFVPSIVHPNVYPSGTVCLSILQDKWKPNITIKQILLGIQDLLDYPNLLSPAQSEAFALLTKNPEKYAALTKEYAKQNSQPFLKPHLPLHNQLDKSGSQQQTMEV